VNASKFYAFSGGRFYVSTNGGQSFSATAASGLPSSGVHFKAVPGKEGDIWLAGDTGLFHSTDSGASFSKAAGISKAVNIGFGKAAPGASYSALYLMGTVNGVTGLFRSNNAGGNWTRINDDQHQYGNAGEALTGDPRVYGRVYLGTNGRGIIYGDTSDTTPTSPPVTSDPPTTEPPTTEPPTTEPPSEDGCTAPYKTTGSWGGGFQGEVTVKNTGTSATTAWKVSWTFGGGQTVSQIWGAKVTQDGAAVSAANESWNGALAPGASTTFGFIGTGTAETVTPACGGE
jgi:cellulase/cellobiase CelA1